MSMRDGFTVGVVQLNSRDDREANIRDAVSHIREAHQAGAELVCLPEVWTWCSDAAGTTDPIPGPLTDSLGELARELDIWLHAGSIVEHAEGASRAFNTTVVFNPQGKIVTRYRKIHLFDADLAGHASYRESNTMQAGDEIVTFDMDGITVGLAICYDLRFPELFRALMERGAEMVILPAAFTLSSGRDHWEPLIRARAIENFCYVVAPAQIGEHPTNRQCFGRSIVVDPWGVVQATAPDAPGVITSWITIASVSERRTHVPALANRRPDVYGRHG